jgi:hypothetical protein
MEGVEEKAAEVGGRPSEGNAEIGAADVADKESVASQDCVRLSLALVEIVDEKRNRFGSVTGSLEGFQANAAEFDDRAIGEGREPIFGLGFGAEIDCGTGAVAKFQVAGDEIGVEMSEEDVFDLQIAFGREGEVAIHIALGINNRGYVGLPIADQVRGVGKAV